MTETMTAVSRRQLRPDQSSRVGPAPDAGPRRLWALDALRIAAIAGVLAIHVIGYRVSNQHAPHNRSWWAAVVVDLGSNWVVPVFVMISGALVLAPRAHAGGPSVFYRRRLVRILPALVVWHLVYLIGVRILMRHERITPTGLLGMLIDGKIYTALYFLWLIAGLYAVAPILAAFLHQGGQRRALALAGGALSWTLVAWIIPLVAHAAGLQRPVTLGAWTMWCPYVGYFVAGWALHRIVLTRPGLVVAAVVAVVALAEVVWHYGSAGPHPVLDMLMPAGYLGLPTAVAAVAIFLFALGVGARVQPGPRTQRVLRRVSEASFGVFLVHLVFVEIAREAFPAVAAADSVKVLIATYVSVLAVSFAVSMAAARIPYVRTVF